MSKKKIDEITKDIKAPTLLDISRIAIGGSLTTENDDQIPSGDNRWAVKVVLSVKRVALNSYHVKATLTTRPSNNNHNEHGMAVKVCSNTSGSAASEWVRTVYSGIFDSNDTVIAEKTVDVEKSGTFYGISRCKHCEYETPHSEKFAQETPGISYTYVNPEIIPTAPSVGHSGNSNHFVNHDNHRAYKGGKITVASSGGTNVTHRLLYMERRVVNGEWIAWNPSGCNTWTNGNVSVQFDGARGYQYRIKAKSKSSTNNESAWSSYQYFYVNDLTKVGNFTAMVNRTNESVTISWDKSTTKIYPAGSVRGFEIGVKNSSGVFEPKAYKSISINQNDNERSLSVDITSFCSVGKFVNLYMRASEGQEWGAVSSSSIKITRNSPPKLSGEYTTTIDDNSIYNSVFEKNFTINWPQITDVDTVTNSGYLIKKKERLNGTWGGWITIASKHTSIKYTTNLLLDDGDAVQFYAQAKDDLDTPGQEVYTRTFYKNKIGNSVQNVGLVGSFSGSVCESVEKIQWERTTAYNDLPYKKYVWQLLRVDDAGNNTIVDSGETTSLSAYPNFSKINRGEQFRARVYGVDTLGKEGHYGYGTKYIKNSLPYFSNGASISSPNKDHPYNGVYLSTIYLTFPTIKDINTVSGSTYNLYYQIKTFGGELSSWQLYQSGITTTNITANMRDLAPEKSSCKFKVYAVDNLGAVSTTYAESMLFKKNYIPPAVTNITVNGAHIGNRYETLTSVTWDKSVGLNGVDCKSYKCELQILSTTGSVASTIRTVTSSTTFTPDINRVARGQNFKISITAIDSFDFESVPATTQTLKRNQVPNAPTGLFLRQARESDGSIVCNCAWTHSVEPDGDSVTYNISRCRNEVWEEVGSRLSLNNFKDIAFGGFNYGDIIKYKVKAIDVIGGVSSYCAEISIVRNTPPEAPVIVAPINNSTVFAKKTRICIDIKNDVDNNKISLDAEVNGVAISSTTSLNSFNKEHYDKLEKAVFLTPQLKKGVNTIKIRTFDSLEYSNFVTLNITLDELHVSFRNIDNQFITSIDNNEINKAINTTRAAYGLQPSSIVNSSKDDFITSRNADKQYIGILDVPYWINQNYTGLNNIYTKPIFADSVITKDKILEIIKVLEEL